MRWCAMGQGAGERGCMLSLRSGLPPPTTVPPCLAVGLLWAMAEMRTSVCPAHCLYADLMDLAWV